MTRYQRLNQPTTYCRYCQTGPAQAARFPTTQAKHQFELRGGLFNFEEPNFYAGPNGLPVAPVTPYTGPNPLAIEQILDLQAQDAQNRHAASLRAANTCHCCNYESGSTILADLSRSYPHLA